MTRTLPLIALILLFVLGIARGCPLGYEDIEQQDIRAAPVSARSRTPGPDVAAFNFPVDCAVGPVPVSFVDQCAKWYVTATAIAGYSRAVSAREDSPDYTLDTMYEEAEAAYLADEATALAIYATHEADSLNQFATESAEYYQELAAEQGASPASSTATGCPVTNRDSNLRSGPGTNFRIIGFAPANSCIPVSGRNSDGTWYVFRDAEVFGSGVGVWIWAELVAGAPVTLPVVSVRVTPEPPAQHFDDDSEQEDLATARAEYNAAAAWEATEWAKDRAEILGTEPTTDGCGLGCTEYPSWCAPPIKGNVSIETGERIYHVPGQDYYNETVIDPIYGERWFCTEAEAQAAGWRRSYR